MEPKQRTGRSQAEAGADIDEPQSQESDLAGHCEDILEIAGLVSRSVNQDAIISEAVDHLARRLQKRARCAIVEGDQLVLRYWSGRYEESQIGGTPISSESVVWKIFSEGVPVNLTDIHQTNGFKHTLKNGIKVKAVVPFGYLDPATGTQRNMGALIVDSGESGLPVSEQEFEYLKIIGYLIGSVVGRIELFDRLTVSYATQQKIVRETAHNFRNRMVVIGGLCRRIMKLEVSKHLEDDVSLLYQEVQTLEEHVDRFESYMGEVLSD